MSAGDGNREVLPFTEMAMQRQTASTAISGRHDGANDEDTWFHEARRCPKGCKKSATRTLAWKRT